MEASAHISFEAIPRNKVYQTVARQLERHITEQLKPGDLLPSERHLAEVLGVSRGSVRDAIRAWRRSACWSRARVSAQWFAILRTLQPIDWPTRCARKRKLVAELIDVRKMIEPHLVARAAHAPPRRS